MNGLLATLNPFNLALASAMTAGSATSPDLSDPPVAVAVNSDPDRGYMGHRIFPALGTSVTAGKTLPQTSGRIGVTGGESAAPNSVSAAPAEGVAIVTHEEAPVPVVAVASIPVSDGACSRSLPRERPVKIGESEPSVMLACAPSESFQPDFERLFNEIMGTA